MNSELLLQLRDIHLPAPLSWWPPAPGWFVLIPMMGVLLFGLSLKLLDHHHHRRLKKEVLRQLETLRLQSLDEDKAFLTLIELSKLMRRIAMNQKPQTEVATLRGASWLQFLDRSGKTTAFSSGAGQVLAEGPYRAVKLENYAELFPLVRSWIKTIL